MAKVTKVYGAIMALKTPVPRRPRRGLDPEMNTYHRLVPHFPLHVVKTEAFMLMLLFRCLMLVVGIVNVDIVQMDVNVATTPYREAVTFQG